MIFYNGIYPLHVLETRSEGLPPMSLQKKLLDIDGRLESKTLMGTAAFHRSENTDDALRYMM